MAWIIGKRGAFRVMWRTGGKGSAVKASKTFASRGDAEEEKRAIEADRAERRAESGAPTSRTPLPLLLKRWGESRTSQGWARKEYVAAVRAELEAVAKDMGWKTLADITAEAMDRWVAKRDGKGVRRPLQYLKGFLSWGKRIARVRVDLAALDFAPAPVIPGEAPPLLTPIQAGYILQAALSHGPQVAALVEHVMLYGCRPVDLSRALVSAYNAKTMEITYRATKNKRDITHPLHADHAMRLDELVKDRGPDEPLFLNAYRDGGWRISERGSAGHLTDWYKANIGRPLFKDKVLLKSQQGIYCLKDFACSRLIVATQGNMKQAMAISGHRTESAFKRYVGTNAQGQIATLEAVPLIEATPWPKPTDGGSPEPEA